MTKFNNDWKIGFKWLEESKVDMIMDIVIFVLRANNELLMKAKHACLTMYMKTMQWLLTSTYWSSYY